MTSTEAHGRYRHLPTPAIYQSDLQVVQAHECRADIPSNEMKARRRRVRLAKLGIPTILAPYTTIHDGCFSLRFKCKQQLIQLWHEMASTRDWYMFHGTFHFVHPPHHSEDRTRHTNPWYDHPYAPPPLGYEGELPPRPSTTAKGISAPFLAAIALRREKRAAKQQLTATEPPEAWTAAEQHALKQGYPLILAPFLSFNKRSVTLRIPRRRVNKAVVQDEATRLHLDTQHLVALWNVMADTYDHYIDLTQSTCSFLTCEDPPVELIGSGWNSIERNRQAHT